MTGRRKERHAIGTGIKAYRAEPFYPRGLSDIVCSGCMRRQTLLPSALGHLGAMGSRLRPARTAVVHPNADLHYADDNVSLLGKEQLDPINYSAHAGRAARITVDNDPVFGSDFWDRWGQSFKQRMAVSHITGQHAAPCTGSDRL